MSKTAWGDIFAFATAVVTGLAIIPAKVAVGIISSETLTFYLFVFAFGWSLPPLILARQRTIVGQVTARQFWLITRLSVVFSIAIFFSWTALAYLEPATQSFLSRIKILVTIIFAIIILKERLNRFEIIGGIVALSGIVLLKFTGGAAVSRGVTLMLLSALLFSGAEIALKSKIADIRPMLFLFYRNLLMIPCFAVIIILRGKSFIPPDLNTAGMVAITALLAPVLGRTFYILAIRRNSLSRTVLINQTQPLITATAGFILLASVPAAIEWIGGALILLGAIIVRSARSAPPPIPPSSAAAE